MDQVPDTDSATAGAEGPAAPSSVLSAAPTSSSLTTSAAEAAIVVADERAMLGLLGSRDAVLRQIEQSPGRRHPRPRQSHHPAWHPSGDRVRRAGHPRAVGAAGVRLGDHPGCGAPHDRHARRSQDRGRREPLGKVLGLNIISRRGRTIRPKTLNQKRYVDAIDANTIVFGIGPAGTGKTYLAMAKAVQSLQAKQVNRIILTRPAVEAGERLGFLPGTLSDKIDPYLRPLYDALHDMLDPESIPRLMAAGTIEVAPLAYMRGRTLNDAFIILDEAQNTTPEQMKMFLTRLGFGSKIVVTGDVTQVDLPGGQRSGLRVVREILIDLDDVEFCRLSSADVVRHRLVGDIVDAYERWDALQHGDDQAGSRAAASGGDGPQRRVPYRSDRARGEHRARPDSRG